MNGADGCGRVPALINLKGFAPATDAELHVLVSGKINTYCILPLNRRKLVMVSQIQVSVNIEKSQNHHRQTVTLTQPKTAFAAGHHVLLEQKRRGAPNWREPQH